ERRGELVEVDPTTSARRGDLLVEGAHGGQRRDEAATVGRDGFENLFPQVVDDHAGSGSRGIACGHGELRERRPSPAGRDALDGYVAQCGERGQLVVCETQVGLVDACDLTLGDETGDGERRGLARSGDEVAVAGQGGK